MTGDGERIPVTCPPREDLVRHALGATDATAGDLTEHLAACPTCRAEVARLRETAGLLRGGAARSSDATPDCLDEEAVASFVDGALEDDGRAAVTTHLVSCARCRGAVAGVGRLVADRSVAQETARIGPAVAERRQLRRAGVMAGLAAAAVMVLLFAWPGSIDWRSESPPHRDPTPIPTQAPVPIRPAGPVAAAPGLEWSAVPGADRYRVTLFDREGRVLWEAQSGDTNVALPDSVTPTPRLPYFWKVEARVGFERWVASELTEFTVLGAGPLK